MKNTKIAPSYSIELDYLNDGTRFLGWPMIGRITSTGICSLPTSYLPGISTPISQVSPASKKSDIPYSNSLLPGYALASQFVVLEGKEEEEWLRKLYKMPTIKYPPKTGRLPT